MNDPNHPSNPGGVLPRGGRTVETVRDFNYRALGTITRDADGRATAQDAVGRTLGHFDGRKTVDSLGRNVFPGDVTKTLILDNARDEDLKRRR